MATSQGLYGKYRVFNSETGEELKSFFVLKPDTDPVAIAALQRYAELTPDKELENDLYKWVGKALFKIGDYAINDDYGVFISIRDKRSKDIINAQKDYRHATEEEIELYYLEV